MLPRFAGLLLVASPFIMEYAFARFLGLFARMKGMGDITIRKALDDHKTVYMPYRNFAERTRVEYEHDLEDLMGFWRSRE